MPLPVEQHSGCNSSTHEVIDCRPSSSLWACDQDGAREEEEEEDEFHCMTAIELAAYEALKSRRELSGQKAFDLAPLKEGCFGEKEDGVEREIVTGNVKKGKHKVSATTDSESTRGLSRAKRTKNERVVRASEVDVEGEIETGSAKKGKRKVSATTDSESTRGLSRAKRRKLERVVRARAKCKLNKRLSSPPSTNPETNSIAWKRKKMFEKMRGLDTTSYHMVDVSSTEFPTSDYSPSAPPPCVPLPICSGYASKKPYNLPLSLTGKKVVAIDCEMINCMEPDVQRKSQPPSKPSPGESVSLCGVQNKPNMKPLKKERPRYKVTAMVSRCTIVDYEREVVYDKFVVPDLEVVKRHKEDTWQSGTPFAEARLEIADILDGCVVIGHCVVSDLAALEVVFPIQQLRDTGVYPPFRRMAGLKMSNIPSLSKLARALLGWEIRRHKHCSLKGARASMELYKLLETHWEKQGHSTNLRPVPPITNSKTV